MKLLTAFKLKLQLGKVTLQIHCEQLHIQDLMTKIDSSSSVTGQLEHTPVEITHYQECVAIRLNNLQQMQEEQTNISYQLSMIDLSDISLEELEKFGLSTAVAMEPPPVLTSSSSISLTTTDRYLSPHSMCMTAAVDNNNTNNFVHDYQWSYPTFSSVSSSTNTSTTTTDK